MHAIPEWFMFAMFLITNPLFWIAVLILVVILGVWIIRTIINHFRKKKDNVITEIPTVDMTK